LRRRPLGVRELVVALENAIIGYVAELGVTAQGLRHAPGVYIGASKLASVGLRIRRGASYHGLALNVSLDLRPFERINVCGHKGLAVTRLADHVASLVEMGAAAAMHTVAKGLTPHLLRQLKFGSDYNAISTDLQAVNSR
jgi:lipoyl(octanoyl) transferase